MCSRTERQSEGPGGQAGGSLETSEGDLHTVKRGRQSGLREDRISSDMSLECRQSEIITRRLWIKDWLQGETKSYGVDCFDYVLELCKAIIKLVSSLFLFEPEIKPSLRLCCSDSD